MKKILPIILAFILNINTSFAQEEVILEPIKDVPYAVSVSDSNLNVKEKTLKEKLSSVDMEVVASVGSINLSVRDVLSLTTGDVVRLSNTQVGDPLTLSVGNRKKFFCQPGVVGKKMAVQITGKIEDVTADDFEELSVEGDDSL